MSRAHIYFCRSTLCLCTDFEGLSLSGKMPVHLSFCVETSGKRIVLQVPRSPITCSTMASCSRAQQPERRYGEGEGAANTSPREQTTFEPSACLFQQLPRSQSSSTYAYRAHLDAHACMNMCDGVRAGVYSHMKYGNNHDHAFIHPACVS